MRKAFTLVEAMVVVAILLTLVSLLMPAFLAAKDAAAKKASGEPPRPSTTWMLWTVQHDGHHWVISAPVGSMPSTFQHHPDCPCSGKVER